MNNGKNNFPGRGFSTPPPSWRSRPFRSPKTAPFLDRKRSSPNSANKSDLFHVIHKIPAGDSPYVKAKQVQVREALNLGFVFFFFLLVLELKIDGSVL